MRKLIVLLTVVAACGLGTASAQAYVFDGWTGVAKTPACTPKIVEDADCGGYGAWWADDGSPAWNWGEICSVELLTGGWVDDNSRSCVNLPEGVADHLTNFTGALAPDFTLSHCGRYYSTEIVAHILLLGGWKVGKAIAPGIEVRCG